MARIGEARRNDGVLAECLKALRRNDDSIDADAGAYAIAEFMNLVRRTSKKG